MSENSEKEVTEDRFPLDEVLAHELGHWIVVQALGLEPYRFSIYGVSHDPKPTALWGKVCHRTALPASREEGAIYVAGHVAERLYNGYSFDLSSFYSSLIADLSCVRDLNEYEVLRTTLRNTPSPLQDRIVELQRSLQEAFAIIEPRMEPLRRMTRLLTNYLRPGKGTLFAIGWSPQLAATLCGGRVDDYAVIETRLANNVDQLFVIDAGKHRAESNPLSTGG